MIARIALGVGALFALTRLFNRSPRHVKDRLAKAHADLAAGVSEANDAPGGGLHEIFRDSGWARGVTRLGGGTIHDWCGMTVAAWAARSGMHPRHRRSFWHTQNVRSFFSYGKAGNVHHRTATHAVVRGARRRIEDWHRAEGKPRVWYEGADLDRPYSEWDAQPGDVLLFDWSGRRDGADHIAMVESFDGRTLVTLEGNASGDRGGRRVRDAVIRRPVDLADPAQRRLIYGWGRFSPLDFLPETPGVVVE